MNARTLWLIGITSFAVVVATAVYFRRERTEPVLPATVQPAAPQQAEEPKIRHPVPAPATPVEEEPLPPLAESDAAMRGALGRALGEEPVSRFLISKSIVKRIVATIDEMPRKKIPLIVRPVVPTGGRFAIAGAEDRITLAAENASRYAPFVEMIEAADASQVAALYLRFYPLFQEAYEDLGYPTGYFNDRLVEVIDHLLETPDIEGPIELVRPKVLYEFKDPQLEGRSAGQKLLLRMGRENAAVVKAKLREIRGEVAGRISQ